MGWISIYGASYNFDQASIFDISQRAGKQFLWILTAFAIGGMLLLIDSRLYSIFAWFIYAGAILLLLITLFVAHDIKGSRSWLALGPVSFQPAELAKMATALGLSKFMSSYNYKLKNWKDLIPLGLIIFAPFVIIILQNETGTALVYFAFLLMLYREGMNGIVLLIGSFIVMLFIIIIKLSIVTFPFNQGTLGMVLGMAVILLVQIGYAIFFCRNQKEALLLLLGTIVVGVAAYILNLWFYINYNYVAILTVVASCIYWVFVELFQRYKKYWFLILFSICSVLFCFSADYLFEKALEPHQQVRIKILLNMENAPLGAGYNVNQSKIAIGSGGFWGKGFLNGTQTKLKYVPEQDTDFIFCTVGEEHGFWGSTLVLFVYWLLLMRILRIAERQREAFSRIYAYCVASILFFHLMINVGMVLGIMPVIGIPLPFFSYGGSSLWGFTILLFILLRLDAARLERMR
jgi:rod shape determining protein RodA